MMLVNAPELFKPKTGLWLLWAAICFQSIVGLFMTLLVQHELLEVSRRCKRTERRWHRRTRRWGEGRPRTGARLEALRAKPDAARGGGSDDGERL
jgi:hypothetical protein